MLVFAFYQYNKAPVFFNQTQVDHAKDTEYKDSLIALEKQYDQIVFTGDQIQINAIKKQYKDVIKKALPLQEVNDTNYIFLRFVIDYLPQGLIGLLIAVIVLAGWGSIAAALNALASCTVVDIHKKFINQELTERQDYSISKLYTLGWGIFCIVIAQFAGTIGNSLIEAVNVVGSVFYGVILGIFLIAFWLKKIGGHSIFYAAIVAQILVIFIYSWDVISFLWLIPIGIALVIIISFIFQLFFKEEKNKSAIPL